MRFIKQLFIALKDFSILFKFWLTIAVVGAGFRIVLLGLYSESFLNDLAFTLLYGLRMDTIVTSVISIFLMPLVILNLKHILNICLLIFGFVYLVVEVSTINFLQQFFVRPNFLFLEHLLDVQQIIGMILSLYPVEFIISMPAIVGCLFFVFLLLNKNKLNGKWWARFLLSPIILVILMLGSRSSIGHATPNPGFYSFSTNNLTNEISNNSIFSLLYSVYLQSKEQEFGYGSMDNNAALEIIRKDGNYQSDIGLHRTQLSEVNKKKNVILVILESFGSDHTGYLGGTDTTPNIDRLTKESMYFTNMYAVGTRTSWGVSSILTSLYPIPGREYIKARKSQKEFYTIAKTFKENNYHTQFLYGGDSRFDNRKGFMLSNGFDQVTDMYHFPDDLQRFTWGYPDENLFDETLTVIEKLEDKPYFLTLLTLSSHEPFDYPKGKIYPQPQEPLSGFANATKYADYAIGQFVEQLKRKGILENTIVAFVSDHGNNAYGNQDVPVHRFKIPAFILTNDSQYHGSIDNITSQIDFGPTVLDLAGIDAKLPTMGQSVLKHKRNHALMVARRKNFAFVTDDGFYLYKDKRSAKFYNERQLKDLFALNKKRTAQNKPTKFEFTFPDRSNIFHSTGHNFNPNHTSKSANQNLRIASLLFKQSPPFVTDGGFYIFKDKSIDQRYYASLYKGPRYPLPNKMTFPIENLLQIAGSQLNVPKANGRVLQNQRIAALLNRNALNNGFAINNGYGIYIDPNIPKHYSLSGNDEDQQLGLAYITASQYLYDNPQLLKLD